MPTLKERYNKLATGPRQQFLQRARHNALLTLPSLVPLEGHNGQSHLIEPHQGLGAQAVTHLSSRVTTALLPAGRPYMRLELPADKRMETNGEVPTTVEQALALSEQLIQTEVESNGWRPSTLQSVIQLIVAGNILEFLQPDNTIRLFRLDQYVVRRDHAGRLVELIIEEKFNKDTLPPGLSVDLSKFKDDEELSLYTGVNMVEERGVKFYRRTQEFDKQKVGGSSTFRVEDLPYFALRWSATPGEDYGRAKVEEHAADLRSLDSLEKAMLEMAAMASRNFILLRPGATAAGLKGRLTRAVNGDVMVGNPDDVGMMSFENPGGFQITAAQVQSLRESIAKAFLLLSAAQRNAERVTAVEIERDVAELEAALGGVFSGLNSEMMERRTHVLILQMQRNGKLPPWPRDAVNPLILTGLEALSRERDVSRAVQAGEITAAFGDDAFDVVKTDKLLRRAFNGLGFPDAVNSPDETEQIRQRRAEREALARGVGAAIGPVAKEAAKASAEQGAN